MTFWNNPQYHKKSQKELELERELHTTLEQNSQLKAQLAAVNSQEHQEYQKNWFVIKSHLFLNELKNSDFISLYYMS